MNGSTSQAIFEAAQTRWLSVDEIVTVLSSAHDRLCRGMPTAEPILEQEAAPPSSPPTSGTVLLYDRVAVRNYKVDGHEWVRKRSNPTKIREDHVKLRHNGEYRVGGNYVHSDEIDTLHRRVYRLIKAAEEKADDSGKELVLVHYLDTDQAAKMPSRIRAIKRGKVSSKPLRRTSGRTKKRMICAVDNEHEQQYNEPMPALPTIAQSTSTSSSTMNEFPKRIRTANSYAKVLESMTPHPQQQQLTSTLKAMPIPTYIMAEHLKMPTLYRQLDWSSNGFQPETQSTASTAATAVPSPESPTSDIDDVDFDDIFDMFSSDAGLCEGLESLIDPAFGAMKQQQQPPQPPMLPPPMFELTVLPGPLYAADQYQQQYHEGKAVTPKEVDPVYMSRAVMANDIPSVGV